jgi:hypothetical protein
VREGFLHAAYGNESDTALGANCDKDAHLAAAKKALPDADKKKYLKPRRRS